MAGGLGSARSFRRHSLRRQSCRYRRRRHRCRHNHSLPAGQDSRRPGEALIPFSKNPLAADFLIEKLYKNDKMENILRP